MHNTSQPTAQALRALADLLDAHPDLPHPNYLTLNEFSNGAFTAAFQYGHGRTPRQNVDALAAWAEHTGRKPGARGLHIPVGEIDVHVYHPTYTDAQVRGCACTEHCAPHH